MLLRKWDICHSEVYDLSLGCVTWARCFTKQTTQQVGATDAGSWWIHTHIISQVDCCQASLDQFLCFLLPPKHHLKVLSKMQSHHVIPHPLLIILECYRKKYQTDQCGETWPQSTSWMFSIWHHIVSPSTIPDSFLKETDFCFTRITLVPFLKIS